MARWELSRCDNSPASRGRNGLKRTQSALCIAPLKAARILAARGFPPRHPEFIQARELKPWILHVEPLLGTPGNRLSLQRRWADQTGSLIIMQLLELLGHGLHQLRPGE